MSFQRVDPCASEAHCGYTSFHKYVITIEPTLNLHFYWDVESFQVCISQQPFLLGHHTGPVIEAILFGLHGMIILAKSNKNL